MDNQNFEVLQRAPSSGNVVNEVCQEFIQLLERVEELEEVRYAAIFIFFVYNDFAAVSITILLPC